MRISRNILNNMMMDNQRKNPLYQTIITDLAITGNIDREDAEMLLGYEIPSFLHTPDGQSIKEVSEDEDEDESEELKEDESEDEPEELEEDESEDEPEELEEAEDDE